MPDSWKLNEIFATGVVLGGYMALMTVVFFWLMHKTDFFTVSLIDCRHNILDSWDTSVPHPIYTYVYKQYIGQVRRETHWNQQPGDDGSFIPPSQYHQSGSYLRHEVSQLVLR